MIHAVTLRCRRMFAVSPCSYVCPCAASGNAATTLWAANEAAGRPASTQQLLDWSAAIGSDISVFFSRGAAYCTGRRAAWPAWTSIACVCAESLAIASRFQACVVLLPTHD